MKNSRFLGVIALIFAVAFSSGCGGDGRVGVSGTVKYKGEAIKLGSISFIEAASGAPAGGAVITNGSYEIRPQPGIKPGNYKVSISAPDPKRPAPKLEATPGESGPAPREYLPAKYNAYTELKAEIKPVTKNVVDFDL